MRQFKDFEQLFLEAKKKAIMHNLTVDDLSENAIVEPELLRILFDDSKDVVGSIDRLFKFLKIRFTTKHNIFDVYKLYDSGTQIKITRVIEPKCSMYYDRATANFYKFSYKIKTIERSETTTDILKSEMKELIEKNISNYKSGTYRTEIKNK